MASRFLHRLVSASAMTLLSVWLAVVLGSAAVYALLAAFAPEHAPSIPPGPLWQQILNALYFSVVNITTLGYGDIVPHGASKILAALEATTGFALFGLLISKLASQRQEQVTDEVHRHVILEAFGSLRQGLFVVRKDLDGVIQNMRGKRVSEDDWETLGVALLHAEALIREVSLLGIESVLDAARRTLLAEAVLRTVRRMGDFLETCRTTSVGRNHCGRYGAEITAFLSAAEEAGKDWESGSDRERAVLAKIVKESHALRLTARHQHAAHPRAPRRRRTPSAA